MKNFIQPGNSIDIVAPSGGTVSGEAIKIGDTLFGVASATRAENEDAAIEVEGVFELPKLSSDVVAVGKKLNWNDTNDELQLATSDLDNVATAVEAKGNGDTLIKVRLTPV